MKELTNELATTISKCTGLEIGADHVHISERRFYYIQEAQPGCAYLLHHYRSPFFVEINKEDWDKMENGEVTVKNFVDSTQWFFGYYWGGGSMVSSSGGGFYTKLEKEKGIHDKELIQRVMNIISKVGWHFSCGARINKEDWDEWKEVSNLYLHDARRDYFNSISAFVKDSFGYKCKGFVCGGGIDDNEVYLIPNSFERSFEVMVGEDIIRKLLYGDPIPDVKVNQYIVMQGLYKNKAQEVHTSEEFNKALDELEILKEWTEWEERIRKNEEHRNAANQPPVKESFWLKLKKLFKAS